jgi:thiol:disulfide interchange protein
MNTCSAGTWWRLSRALLALAFVLLPAVCAAGHLLSDSNPVAFTTETTPSASRSGEVAEIIVKASIAPGWHLYSLTPTPPPGPAPTTITVIPAPNFISDIGPAIEDTPVSHFDPNFGKTVAYHVVSATFRVPIRIAQSVGKSVLIEPIGVQYQVCNDRVCLPPSTIRLSVPITADPGPVRAQYARMPAPPVVRIATPGSVAPAAARVGLAAFLAAAFVAGLLALLTPCVFPLIPVTFGFFTKQAGENHSRLIGLAGAYAVGIIVSFTLLGLVAALTFGAAGANRVAANPWFNLFFGALFVVFAFSFFETFLITLPPFLMRFARPLSGAGGPTGVLFMGFAFVFAAFTCTAPFIGTVLVAAASATGSGWLRPLLGMLVFAVALALPFFLLALFPGLLSRLPRSGGWLTRFKATLGFVELAYALTYFSKADLVWQAHILTAPVILGLWAALAIACGLYLFGLLRVSAYPEERARQSGWRIATAVSFFAAGMYCLYAMTGRPVSGLLLAYLPPAGYGSSAQKGAADSDWLSNYNQGLIQARASDKPVFIDFTGYTCTNCRYVEQNIFPKSPVDTLLAGSFTRVRLYTDGGQDGPGNERLQQTMFGTVALPLYAIVSPTGKVVSQLSGSGHSVEDFAQFMTNGLTASASTAPSIAQSWQWAPYSIVDMPASAQAGKPVIIDFTASWCTNCHALERHVFTDRLVFSKLGSFDTYSADLTDFGAAKNVALEKQYDILALPAVLFFDEHGKEVEGTRVTGLVTAKEFARRMDRTLAQSGAAPQQTATAQSQ